MSEHLLTEKSAKPLLAVLLVITGVTLMTIRWFSFDSDRVLEEDTAWKVTIHAQIQADDDSTTILTVKPKSGRYSRVISQRLYHPSFRLKTSKSSGTGNISARALQAGKIDFITEFHILLSNSPVSSKQPLAMDSKERETYLSSDAKLDLSVPALANLNNYLNQGISNKQALVEKIFMHSQKIINTTAPAHDELRTIVTTNKATNLGRARLMVALCRLNDIPARLVTGVILRETPRQHPHYWVQIYNEDEQWINYDPLKGFKVELPHNYIILAYDNPYLYTVQHGRLLSTKLDIEEDTQALNFARLEQEKDILDIFDLRRLDLDTRDALIKILLLPFCVLLTTLFRQVLGFYPYGTFTASLLALAMIYAEPLVTITIAAIVISLALLGRSLLPDSYPRAPRLSLIFTFVAISMVFSVSILSYLDVNPGGNIILLPTIILAAIVDRFYSYMDESGAHAALLRMAVTIMIATLCIPVLKFEDLGLFILTFPETHFITAALVLLLSGYKGKKLTDNRYLKLLGENKPKKTRKKKTTTEAPAPTPD